MKKYLVLAVICLAAAINFKGTFIKSDPPHRLEILFLGHTATHHLSDKLAEIVQRSFFKDGINITYTTNPNDLNEATSGWVDPVKIRRFDALCQLRYHIKIARESAIAVRKKWQRVHPYSLRVMVFPKFGRVY